MFNAPKDQLFTLINSLTKAEKRNFKLYANRFQGGGDSKFIQLFDVLDRLSEYDEEEVLKRLPDVEKRHLPNLKRHLYKQILTSLRLIYIQKNIDIQIREQLDFARILYGKGMYMQSLRILDRIKKIANEHHQDILHLEILEFQKLIEARHITRSRLVEHKMESLLEESARRSWVSHSTSLFSNFNIQIHGWYIQNGHVKNEEDVEKIRAYFEEQIPPYAQLEELTFFEKANLFQGQMWYQYILLNFKQAIHHADDWVALFKSNNQMKEKDPGLYMRALYYMMVLNYLTRNQPQFARYLQEFREFVHDSRESFNDNSRMIAFVYLNLSQLNFSLMSQDFEQGIQLIGKIEERLPQFEAYTDVHRILLFYFKFAYLYFSVGQYDKALDYLNKIIHLKSGHLRDDLQNNARLLHMLCHYELQNWYFLDNQMPSVKRLLQNSSDVSELPVSTLHFLRKLANLPPAEHPAAFRRFQKKLARLANKPYEKKALNYLDIPAWVEQHLQEGVKV